MAVAVSPTGQEMVIDVMGRLWLLPVDGGTASPITDEMGNARQPSWSPDGAYLTFQAYWEGNWHIYTVARDGSQLTQITEGDFDSREPHWSPDGSSIIFASDHSGNYDIYQYAFNSQKTIQLTSDLSNEYGPCWSPNGESVAYVSDHPDQSGIWTYSMASENNSLIQPSEKKVFGVAWSKDGATMTYNEQAAGSSTLHYSHPENSEFSPKQISASTQDVFPFRVSWLDSEQFLYTSDGEIMRSTLTGQSTEKISFEFTVQLNRPSYTKKKRNFNPAENLAIKGICQPQLSPDGNSIAAIMLGDIWIIDKNGEGKKLTDDGYYELSPMWSPQGDRLAFLSDRSGIFELYVHHFASGEQEKIGSILGMPSGMSWSPSAEQIAVSTNFGPRLGRVFSANLVTGEIKSVTPMLTSSLGAPSWSPDGELIAFSILQPYSTLYREGVNGVVYYDTSGMLRGRLQGVDTLSLGVRAKDGPLWSPDGQYLASISSGRLWVFPVDSAGQLRAKPMRLTTELADNPSWSGDSQEILYMATNRLRKINIATGEIADVAIDLTWDRQAPSGELVIHAGTLFDGTSEEVVKDVDVFISGHRITEIRAHQPYAGTGTFIDASQQFVMPGLIDGHSHQGSYEGEKLDRGWLAWGVTATRDPASEPYDAINRREARESGHTIGPRIFFTGSPIDGNRIYYPGASALESEEQIDLEMRRADLLDYDMIKTYVRLSDPLQRKVIEGAHAIGIPVSSHELYPAVVFGVDGIEHISGTSRRGYSAKLSSRSKAYSDVTTLIAKSGMTFTPTTGIYISYKYLLAEDPAPLSDPRVIKFANAAMLGATRSSLNEITENPEPWKDKFENTLKMVRDVHEQGGFVTAGTDSPIIPYGFSLHMELEAYVRAGISSFEVLKSCTSNAAKLIHAEDELGAIQPGMLADLLILDENPLEDIKNTRSMNKVIVNGRVFTREELLNN